MRPLSIPSYIACHLNNTELLPAKLDEIRHNMEMLTKGLPLVSIVIPAYNEEENILRTLSSISKIKSHYSIEVIVVDNNSKDNTAALARRAGAKVITELKQGVKHARTTGLYAAVGKYILNGDADTIYSPYWVDCMVAPLLNETIAMSYGRFSFFTEGNRPRLFYFLYETLSDPYKAYIAYTREKAIYVYGCSSCYRKEQALAVNAFEHPPGANEDGYLGLKLSRAFGKLHKVTSNRSLAWTSDRRLIEQGGVFNAFTVRLKKVIMPRISRPVS